MGKLFVFTGARGVGKTTLAATYAPPGELGGVYWHDSEDSANGILEEHKRLTVSFGRYVSLKARFRDLPSTDDLLHRIRSGKFPWVSTDQKHALASYWEFILRDLDENLKSGQFKVYVHDTLEKMEAAMAAWVDINKKAAGVISTSYGGLWTQGVFPLYEQLLDAIEARGVETIILTSHLRTPWEDNRPVVGKVEPAGKQLLYKMSRLFLWLVNDDRNADGAPAALVLKERLGGMDIVDGKWRPRRGLPHRVPHCAWEDIAKYRTEGCDLLNPKPGESMSRDELQTISEFLTDEQMRLMVLGAAAELETMKMRTVSIVPSGAGTMDFGTSGGLVGITQPSPGTDRSDEARAMAANGSDEETVAIQLGVPLAIVRRWLRAGDGGGE